MIINKKLIFDHGYKIIQVKKCNYYLKTKMKNSKLKLNNTKKKKILLIIDVSLRHKNFVLTSV